MLKMIRALQFQLELSEKINSLSQDLLQDVKELNTNETEFNVVSVETTDMRDCMIKWCEQMELVWKPDNNNHNIILVRLP